MAMKGVDTNPIISPEDSKCVVCAAGDESPPLDTEDTDTL